LHMKKLLPNILFPCLFTLLATYQIHGQTTPPKLESLKGTLHIITEEGGRRGTKTIATRIWAKGDNTRIEMLVDSEKVISIQRGNTIYVYRDGEKVGTRHEVSGLAAMGLVRQIDYIKSKGKITQSEMIKGEIYNHYELREAFPGGIAEVLLSAKTSLPRTWFSVARMEDGTAYLEEYLYSDVEGNVVLPDQLFELPSEVKFN
jgi:outer membrane lipoprotein-sorting protein